MKRFTQSQLDGMVRDACMVEAYAPHENPLVGDLCCHVKALAVEAEQLGKAEEALRDIAWNADDWSGPDILAAVADYFGCTVAELLRRMKEAGS